MIYALSFKHDLTKFGDDAIVIDCTSNSQSFAKWLSPFYVGPCELYDGYIAHSVENGYQFSKLYFQHADTNGYPTNAYFEWAIKGWNTKHPIKFPMGAWNKPLHYWWNGRILNRVEAKRLIFAHLYKEAVVKISEYKELQDIYYANKDKNIILLDYEGFDHRFLDLSYDQVLDHPDFSIGQCFILCMLLEGFL